MERGNIPYYGTEEVYGEADWQLVGSSISVVDAPKSFWDYQIEYHQPDVSNSSCSLHACLWALSDLTGYKFGLEEIKWLWNEAKKDGASEWWGWWMYKAVDLVRHYRNNTHPLSTITSWQIRLGWNKYRDVLDKWYSVIVGYRWNRLYNNDVDDNCILEWYEFGEGTYWHAIRTYKKRPNDFGKLVNGIYWTDNYEKTKNCNVYRLAQNARLIENNVFFSYGYFYSFINNPMSNVILPRHIQPSSGAERSISLAWENIMTKYMEDGGKPSFKNYVDDYAITRMLIEIHDLRKKWYDW